MSITGKLYNMINMIIVDGGSQLKLTHEQIEILAHTSECISAREKERIARAAYENSWPRYCRICDGEGGSSSREYRGECHGVPAYETTYDYCPDCVQQGVCPRCGSVSNNFEDDDVQQLRCAACDWKEGDAGCPMVEFDCGCLYPD